MSDSASDAGADMRAFWNGPAGTSWVEKQVLFDEMYQPIVDALAWSVVEEGARSVLDVGCGTGAAAIEIARALGADGRVLGVDVSAPMIASAQENAREGGYGAEFVLADAETHAFEPEMFDMLVSRFGVMFFGDPVAAFANMRGAMRKDGRMRVFTWRHPRDNAFMTVAGRVARDYVPDMPKFDPEAPGQFGLAVEARIRRVLGEAGWREVELAPMDFDCEMPAAELIPFFTTRGPLGQAFPDMDKGTQEKVVADLREAFAEYVHGDVVRYMAATWDVRARAS